MVRAAAKIRADISYAAVHPRSHTFSFPGKRLSPPRPWSYRQLVKRDPTGAENKRAEVEHPLTSTYRGVFHWLPATPSLQRPATPVHSESGVPTLDLTLSSTLPLANRSVSDRPRIQSVASSTVVDPYTNVPSVATDNMEPTPAQNKQDPQRVVTPLDPDGLELALRVFGIFDQWSHIVYSIRHGFDVGIENRFSRTVVHPNHASSNLNPDFISSYIQSEIAGRYSCAFTRAELEDLIGPFCTSPLGLVPKDVTSLRLIQDLSFPRHPSPISSINSQVDSDKFPTS